MPARCRSCKHTGLPDVSGQEVAEYLLREPLGQQSLGVLCSETLLALLQAGCREPEEPHPSSYDSKLSLRENLERGWQPAEYNHVSLSTEALAALPPAAAAEVKRYLARLLKESLVACRREAGRSQQMPATRDGGRAHAERR